MAATIFKSEAARKQFEGWYEKFFARVPGPVERQEVPTELGPSHVLLAGNPDGPSLVVLHGALASSAHVVSELGALVERYRIVAPDVPGQSVHGPQVQPPLKDDTLARWLIAILDSLGLGTVNLMGVSWGGFIARKTASFAPQRVRRLVLYVPAGIVTGSMWAGFTRMMWPMTMYRLFPSERRLRTFIGQLFSTWDDDWARCIGDAVRGVKMDFRIPPLATDEELRALAMPVLAVAGEEDVSFPGAKLLARIQALVTRAETELIAGSKHSPPTTDAFRAWTAERVTRFLEVP